MTTTRNRPTAVVPPVRASKFSRAECPGCRNTHQLRADGTLVRHTGLAGRCCSGSHGPYVEGTLRTPGSRDDVEQRLRETVEALERIRLLASRGDDQVQVDPRALLELVRFTAEQAIWPSGEALEIRSPRSVA